MSQQVRVLSMPIFRKYWLYHAWQDASVPATNTVGKHWRQGATLNERTRLLASSMQTKVSIGQVVL